MNLLTCNLVSQTFGNGLPKQNVPQRMQFHHAAGPSLKSPSQNSKNFQNPNIFTQKSPEKSIPSSYKQQIPSEDTNDQRNLTNSCDMILEPTKQTSEDKISMNDTKKTERDMEKVEAQSEASDDSFIVFESEEGAPLEEPAISSDDDSDDSSSDDDDDDDDDWNCRSVVFFNSKLHTRERQASVTESEDSFVVFGDADSDGCSERDEDDMDESSEDEDDKNEVKKPDNGKRVKFADGPGFCKIHLMVKWSFAYQKARKGLWEQFGRDNERFRFRAVAFGDKLNRFLQPEHRRKVYEERFKDTED